MIISKNTKIFLSLFFIILVIITVLAIIYTNKHKGSNESQIIIEDVQKLPSESFDNFEQLDDKASGISLKDTYSTNGIIYTYNEKDENGVHIKYPIIDGLKDESIQESINEQILEKIKKVLDSNNFKNNSDDSAYAEAFVVGNFSDVLSIKIFVKFSQTFSKNYGINFRLDNGEKIKIDEIFLNSAPRKNIITMSAYKSFALGYYTNEGLSNDFYSNIESDILKFLIDYNSGRVAEFSFTPMYIEIYRDGKSVKIEIQEYSDYIAIYSRFKSTNDLYKNNENIVSNIPVLTKRMSDIVYDLYEKVDDYCILDVYIVKANSEKKEFSEREMRAINNYKKDLISRLEYVKRESPIYYSNFITVSRGKENNEEILIFSEKESYVRTEENEFYDRVYGKILGFERDINNESYVGSKIGLLKDNNIEKFDFEVKYSLETGYELKNEEQEEGNMPEESEDDGMEDRDNQEQENTEDAEDVPANVVQSPDPYVSQSPVPTPTPSVSANITTQVYF